jgi:hypothetical protein
MRKLQMRRWLNFGLQAALIMQCQTKNTKDVNSDYTQGTFGYDLEFLSENEETIVLEDGPAMAAIVPAYQGRVMTSTANGMEGMSFGWINYELIASGEVLQHFNPLGGEDRFWLGPEGGQYSIFFESDAEFTLEDWYTPPPIDTKPFRLVSKSGKSVEFEKDFEISNYSGEEFNVRVNRKISLLSRSALEEQVNLPHEISFVGFESVNVITNIGENPWTRNTGALSIWILGMFTPTDETTVIIPYNEGNIQEMGSVVNDKYFGSISEDRLHILDGVIFFRADGKSRGKIGLNPKRAKDYLGSYDAKNKVLTIVFYTKPKGVEEYVNSLWEIQDEPFAGDVVNSYNDGPVNGSMLGPFYELETSSPAAFLGQNESITHIHKTFHIQGEENTIEPIVRELFHTDLATIRSVFQ